MQQQQSRRTFIKRTGLSLAGLGIVFAGCKPTQTRPIAKSNRKHPNILVILTDDQRHDSIGAINPLVETPAIDALIQDGVHFTRAYVTTSNGFSSRASLFSGQHSARHKIYDPQAHFTHEGTANTYYGKLWQTGYRTGFIGRYGMGQGQQPPQQAFDAWHGFMGQGKYETTDEHGRYKHLTRVIGDQALNFLDSQDPKQAFCLSVSFKAPHCQDDDPRFYMYDPAYKDHYADVTFPPPVTAEQWLDFPEAFRENNKARKLWSMRLANPDQYQASIQNYHRLLYGVDVQIARIRKKLTERGLDKNTLIVFTSDNGVFLGEHGMAGKWYGLEPAIRVPLVIVDPTSPTPLRGTQCDKLVLNIDLAPTILAATHVNTPPTMQGESLLPLLQGDKISWRKDFYYDHLMDLPGVHPCEGLVSERWKYMRYPDIQPKFEMLYDLKNDPTEITNRADDPEFSEELRQRQLRFEVLKKQVQ